MKGKLIDSTHIKRFNPVYIEENGIIYTNPLHNPDVDLLALGYKDIVDTTKPSYNEETQVLTSHYVEKASTIEIVWEVRNLTQEEIAERERLNALMMGEGE